MRAVPQAAYNFTEDDSNFSWMDSIVDDGMNRTSVDKNVFYVIESLFLLIITVTGAIGNVSIILVIKVQRLYGRPGNLFFINLAIADLLITLVIVPIITANVISHDNVLGDGAACRAAGFAVICCAGLSVYTLVGIAFDRYINVCHTDLHRRIFTKKSVLYITIGIWIVSIITTLPCVTGWGEIIFDESLQMCSINRQGRLSHIAFVLVIGFALPTTSIVACYMKIFLKIKSVQKTIKTQLNIQTSAMHKRNNRRKASAMKLFIIFVTFEVYWIPFGLVLVTDQFQSGVFPKHFERFAAWFAISNSCVNSFLYGLLSQEFRKGYRKLYCAFKKKNGHTFLSTTSRCPSNNSSAIDI